MSKPTIHDKKTERIQKLRTMMGELEGIPPFAQDVARAKVERKARKWGISLTEFAESGKKSIKAVVGRLKGESKTTVQTLIFAPKSAWTADDAKAWLSKHDFTAAKVDETGDSLRFRQRDPGDFQEGTFRTIPFKGREEHDTHSGFAARLLALTESMLDGKGRTAYRIPVALTGEWVKGKPFAITAKDLDTIIQNFEKRGNGEIVVDYEHASENPDVALGGPVPGAGWLTAPEKQEVDGVNVLSVLYAPTERAKDMIDRGEYQYVSPAIDWGIADKKTGEAQGATLTSTALTNHPFLDQLPALRLRDTYWSPSAVLMTDFEGGVTMKKNEQIDKMRLQATELEKQGKKDEAKVLLAEADKLEADSLAMDDKTPKLKLRRMGDGPHKGKIAVCGADGAAVGYLTEEDMKHGEPDADDKKMCDWARGKKLQLTDIQSLVEKGQTAVAKDAEGDGKRLLMKEAVTRGCLDRTKAAFAANEHRSIKTSDYVAVETADAICSEAVRTGKLPPVHREEIFEDVVANPEKWKKIFASAVPIFNVDGGTGAPGSTDGGAPNVAERVNAATRKYMTDHANVKDFAVAMRQVLSEDQALNDEYQRTRGKAA